MSEDRHHRTIDRMLWERPSDWYRMAAALGWKQDGDEPSWWPEKSRRHFWREVRQQQAMADLNVSLAALRDELAQAAERALRWLGRVRR